MIDSYSIEMLEVRIQSMKIEMRHLNIKVVVELVISTCFLAWTFGMFFAARPAMWFVLPLAINALAWQYWITLRFRSIVMARFGGRPHRDPGYDSAWEDYREHEFFLQGLRRRGAIFDVAFGVQFLMVAVALVVHLLLG